MIRSSRSSATKSLTRRHFLRLAGLAGLSGPVAALLPFVAAQALEVRRWSDPATWGGQLPGKDDVVQIRFPILLDMDARVAGVVIRPGGDLIFHPRKSVRLASTGNVVVRGRLTMRPDGHAVRHRLVFLNVNERRFRGGGMKVLARDVGLWVMHHGQLSITGSSKLAWTRTAGGVPAGATILELTEDPVGWRVGDQLVLTPTESPSVPGHHTRYDSVKIAAISGKTITISRSTKYAHPSVEVRPGVVFTPEVLNLTRNVRIEGTRRGRAHIFIHSMHAQTIRHASIRYMGPRKPDGSWTNPVLGRYGLHFHHCKDGSRGSVVIGVVVTRSGNHAFVPHLSDGVTFRNCISHNTFEDAYWWDPSTDTHDSFSNDTVYERCVASMVKKDPPFRGVKLTGFQLGALNGNIARGCVSIGVQGKRDASGFMWPGNNQGVWEFQDNNLAHNNKRNGIFVWQNGGTMHSVRGFTAYHNGEIGTTHPTAGVAHGAYGNNYQYEDLTLFANGDTGILLYARPGREEMHPISLAFRRGRIDAAGAPSCVMTANLRKSDSPRFLTIKKYEFVGHTLAALHVRPNKLNAPDFIELIDCTFHGNELWLEPDIHPDSVIRIVDSATGSVVEARRHDQLLLGTFKPEWNAVVR